MSEATILALLSLGVTAGLGVLMWVNHHRANKTSEKKLSVDEQVVRDGREATVAQQRLEELNRLHPRLEALEVLCEELKLRLDASDQQTFEMIRHIVVLEQMVPNPPGPPTRPNWKLPLLVNRAAP